MSELSELPGLAPTQTSAELRDQLRRLVLVGASVIVVGFLGVIAWAAFAPLSGSIVATGVVKVDSNRKTVQHRDGGIVREILVHEGEEVERGQALVLLDDARIDSSFDLLRSQFDAEIIRRARLTAERDYAPGFSVPAEVAARQSDSRVAEMLRRERGIFSTRRQAIESQLNLTRRQIGEVEAEIAARQSQDSSAVTAIKLMDQEVAANEALLSENFINRTKVMTLQRAAAEYRMRQGENAAERAKATQRKSELELKMVSLRETYATEASAELRDTGNKIVDIEERLRAARDAAERKVIAAPVAGRVVDLRVTTAGSPIGPRDPVLDVVPRDNPLIVEAHVPLDAISELRQGLLAQVRLTAYRQRTTPLVEGRVTYVSADALSDKQASAPHFVVYVELSKTSLKAAGALNLHPGMAAEVYIKTSERTALDYLLEPVLVSIRRAFRDH
jgi:epimerase transport system membrane fusion protein